VYIFFEGDLELQKVDPERGSSAAASRAHTHTHARGALAICDTQTMHLRYKIIYIGRRAPVYPADVPCGETTPSDDETNVVEYYIMVVKRRESIK